MTEVPASSRSRRMTPAVWLAAISLLVCGGALFVVFVVVPAVKVRQRAARQAEGAEKVREIQRNLGQYAQTKAPRFEGLDREGVIEDAPAKPDNRFQLLLEDDYFNSDYQGGEGKVDFVASTVEGANFDYVLRAFGGASQGVEDDEAPATQPTAPKP